MYNCNSFTVIGFCEKVILLEMLVSFGYIEEVLINGVYGVINRGAQSIHTRERFIKYPTTYFFFIFRCLGCSCFKY